MNTNRQHVFLCGGTGEEFGKGLMLIRESCAMFTNKPLPQLSIMYVTLDEGGKSLSEMKKLSSGSPAIPSRDPNTQFGCTEVASVVRDQIEAQQEAKRAAGRRLSVREEASAETGIRMRDIAPAEYEDRALLRDATLDISLKDGYIGNMMAGSTLSDLIVKSALNTEADQKYGFRAVIDEVINSNRTYRVYAAFVSSGSGGEGRTNISVFPLILREKCLEAVQRDLHLEEDAARAYVEDVLKIAVIMVGAVCRYPRPDKEGRDTAGLSQDTAGLTAGTLQNFPVETIEAIDAFYLLEHDHMPVQADRFSKGNNQFKHAHAIQLVAYDAMEDFFSKTPGELESLRSGKGRKHLQVLIPHYALPGNIKTNWKNLCTQNVVRQALSARIRFDGMIFLWLSPQLHPEGNPNDLDQLYASDFLCKLFGARKKSELRRMHTIEELKKEVLNAFEDLEERETIFLHWLRDISLTGRDWKHGLNPDETIMADLFPVDEIDRVLGKCGQIADAGGMTGYDLDRLTACSEGNLYSTGRTPDWIRMHLKYPKKEETAVFNKISENLYNLCADASQQGFFLRRVSWHS